MNGLLSDPFTLVWGACQGCPLSIVMPEVPAIFIDVDITNKEVQIGDHEIEE